MHVDTIYNKLIIINKSARPLIVRRLYAHTIDVTEATGDTFIEDVVGSFLNIKGQRVWAWQYNLEAGVNIATGADADVTPAPPRSPCPSCPAKAKAPTKP